MDLQMPRFSGAEATRAILEAYPQTQVIILTADARKIDRRELGASGYLSKSQSLDELLATLYEVTSLALVLGSRPGEPPPISRLIQ